MISRKNFLLKSGAALLLTKGIPAMSAAKLKAIAFDAFPIFDPRPIFQTITKLFPDNSKQLINVWQSRQFSYQWLRTLGENYKNFLEVTADALRFAAVECNLLLTEEQNQTILRQYKNLTTWHDVAPALELLKREGLRLCFLSNMTREMLTSGIENAKIGKFFDCIISTDEMRTYKPAPAAYQMAVDKLNLTKEEILFVAFAGWDVAGAKWFGFPTYWVNRLKSSKEQLDGEPDGTGFDLSDLVKFIRSY